ncbi:MAG: hypothetical protein ABI597_00770 [Gammaproteobacteria bacterium]
MFTLIEKLLSSIYKLKFLIKVGLGNLKDIGYQEGKNMPATEPLCNVIGLKPHNLSREEFIVLEIELFVSVCEELKEILKTHYKDYFRFMKFNEEMEKVMLEDNFIRFVINDILLTEEYSLQGIAHYTQTTEDVIEDVASGLNPAPSLPLSRRIIDLHRSVRPNLYREIMKKITTEYLMSG